MAKKRVTRKQLLKEPDEFLTFTEKAVLFIKEHDREFKYVAGALAAILLIYLGVNAGMDTSIRRGKMPTTWPTILWVPKIRI